MPALCFSNHLLSTLSLFRSCLCPAVPLLCLGRSLRLLYISDLRISLLRRCYSYQCLIFSSLFTIASLSFLFHGFSVHFFANALRNYAVACLFHSSAWLCVSALLLLLVLHFHATAILCRRFTSQCRRPVSPFDAPRNSSMPPRCHSIPLNSFAILSVLCLCLSFPNHAAAKPLASSPCLCEDHLKIDVGFR